MAEFGPRWLITCSCGWERTASSAWAATAVFRLHARYVGATGTEHIIAIAEPPDQAADGQQLPRT